MQYGQNRSIAHRVKKFVGMPTGGQRPGLRFSIAHHHGHNQVRIVERRSKPVGDAVSQLAAFMDRAWSFRSAMAADSPRKRELLKKLLQANDVLALVWINL